MPKSNAISRYVTDCHLTQENKLSHYNRVVWERGGQVMPGAQAGLFLNRVSLIVPFTGMLGDAWSVRMRPTLISLQFVVRVES
jgi:hypothetical protein